MEEKFFGKYRGMVLNNIDTENRGRIIVQLADVYGLSISNWALPCVPFTGIQSGAYFVPPIGAGVWVEFEGGDPGYPIWTGGFWGSAAEVPALALAGVPASPNIVLQTTGQNTLMVSDLQGPTGGIMLKSPTGASLIVNDTGIYIQNGKGASVVLSGPSVTINNGAFVIT